MKEISFEEISSYERVILLLQKNSDRQVDVKDPTTFDKYYFEPKEYIDNYLVGTIISSLGVKLYDRYTLTEVSVTDRVFIPFVESTYTRPKPKRLSFEEGII